MPIPYSHPRSEEGECLGQLQELTPTGATCVFDSLSIIQSRDRIFRDARGSVSRAGLTAQFRLARR